MQVMPWCSSILLQRLSFSWLFAGSFAAVRLRLQSLKGAVRLKMTAAPPVVREVKEASGQQHAVGGYAFRQRKAPGALAEPSAGTVDIPLRAICRAVLTLSTYFENVSDKSLLCMPACETRRQ